MTDAPASVPAITATVNAPLAITLDATALAKLAHEIARGIRDIEKILPDYKLTVQEFEASVKPNPFFQRAIQAAVLEWNAAGSTAQRLKLKAQTGFEQEILPMLITRASSEKETLNGSTEAAKLIAKIAGIDGEKAGQQTSGEKFTITIDLGGDKQLRFERDIAPTVVEQESAPALQIDGEVSAESAAIQPLTEKTGLPVPVSPLPKGERNGS